MTSSRPRSRGLASLIAAAKRLTSRNRKREEGRATSWHNEAWAMYDQVGELHFATNTLANAMSRVELYITKLGPDGPERVEDEKSLPVVLLNQLGNGKPEGLGEHVKRFGQHHFVTGDSYLVGLPEYDELTPMLTELPASEAGINPFVPETSDPYGELDLGELCWKVYSTEEVQQESNRIRIEGREYHEDQVLLLRIHEPHPRRCIESDSPVRASLPVLRELVGLTMHVSACIDSRLAGAGILEIPASAAIMAGQTAGDTDDEQDDFIEALIDTMTTPIANRDSAAAHVPIVIVTPDDSVGKINHISFATPLDGATKDLRDEAIRRLALGLDIPPEVLLGMGDSNHWAAWQIQEESVRLHVMPPVITFCDAVTTEYIRPALKQAGWSDDEVKLYGVAGDPAKLIRRPNLSSEAQAVYDRGELSGDRLREANSFGPEDKPLIDLDDKALSLALELVRSAPTLLSMPGLQSVVAQIRAVLDGTPMPDELDPMLGKSDASKPEPGPADENTDPKADGGTAPEADAPGAKDEGKAA